MSDQTVKGLNKVRLRAIKSCPYNHSIDEVPCEAYHHGYLCTRVSGHDGPHAACGWTEHPIVIWEDDR